MKRLIAHEYIRLDVRTSCNIYEILPKGQPILRGGSDLFKSGMCRLHNLRYKYEILSGGISGDQWEKVKMVNWTKQIGDVYGVKVEVSQRSIVISPGVFFGYQQADLLPKAKGVADSIAEWLRCWYHLELGDGESVAKPEWAVVTPLPSLPLSDMSLRKVDSWIDASRGKTEIEFTDMDRAQEFIEIPKKLDEINSNILEHRSLTEVNHQSSNSKPEVNQDS